MKFKSNHVVAALSALLVLLGLCEIHTRLFAVDHPRYVMRLFHTMEPDPDFTLDRFYIVGTYAAVWARHSRTGALWVGRYDCRETPCKQLSMK